MHTLHVPRASVATACGNPRDPRPLLFPQVCVPGARPGAALGANEAAERGGGAAPATSRGHDVPRPRQVARHTRVLAAFRSEKTAEG